MDSCPESYRYTDSVFAVTITVFWLVFNLVYWIVVYRIRKYQQIDIGEKIDDYEIRQMDHDNSLLKIDNPPATSCRETLGAPFNIIRTSSDEDLTFNVEDEHNKWKQITFSKNRSK